MDLRRRRGPEALRRALRILPIALRHQRPAMDQFARLVVGSNAAVGATDEDFRIRDRAAHRGRMAGDQRGVEIGRTTCLRSAETTSELQSLLRISVAVLCFKKQKLED